MLIVVVATAVPFATLTCAADTFATRPPAPLPLPPDAPPLSLEPQAVRHGCEPGAEDCAEDGGSTGEHAHSSTVARLGEALVRSGKTAGVLFRVDQLCVSPW